MIRYVLWNTDSFCQLWSRSSTSPTNTVPGLDWVPPNWERNSAAAGGLEPGPPRPGGKLATNWATSADEYTEAGKQQSNSGSVIIPEVIQQGTENKVQTSPLSVRPKRVAALAALEKNRELMLQNHYFK